MADDKDEAPPEVESIGVQTLRFIERFEYRGHEIKIARRGHELRLLIYPPQAVLATRMVTGTIDDIQRPIDAAKRAVDEMTKARGSDPADE